MPSTCMQSPVGPITITSENGAIISIEFKASKKNDETPELSMAKEQLEAYFDGKLQNFSLKLNPKGTPFQQKVWKALESIPYGQCVSYKTIAEKIKRSTAIRAVGGANSKNPLPILIPCHRVIGASGKLVGYSGGMDKKIALLKIEGYDRSSKSI